MFLKSLDNQYFNWIYHNLIKYDYQGRKILQNINYQYIKGLHSYFQDKKINNFINIDVISKHFKKCLFDKSFKNQRISRYNSIDKHIKIGLHPDMMYTGNPNTNNIELL